MTVKNAPNLIAHTRYYYDRGPRPITRGWFHHIVAWLAVIAGTILSTYSYLKLPGTQATGVLIYTVGVVLPFGVSAAYHRGPWKSLTTITWL